MGKLQIAMTDEERERAYEILSYAQGKFLQEEKERFPLGKTILKILEEWSTTNNL